MDSTHKITASGTHKNFLKTNDKLHSNATEELPLQTHKTLKTSLTLLKENFTENTYQNRDTDNHINNTVNTFISTNPTTYLDPVLPDEIKKSSSKKAPALGGCSILKDARDRRRLARMIIESSRSGGGLNCYEWVVMDVDMIVEST
ncbi:hypothetical protein TNCV_272761 [Trichonephila clavipes]|nr:hypothetical protein TNCV_272761 [Trichonephila clavipes]